MITYCTAERPDQPGAPPSLVGTVHLASTIVVPAIIDLAAVPPTDREDSAGDRRTARSTVASGVRPMVWAIHS